MKPVDPDSVNCVAQSPATLCPLSSACAGPFFAVMDCIVSSEVLACCSDYRPLKFFLIQLALATASQMVRVECCCMVGVVRKNG